MDHILLLAVIGVVLFIVYIWYAGIIAKKNKALEALSGIDVQLKKRNNLIPNILKIAARFMNHEKELMEKITKLRTKVSDGYNADDAQSIKKHLQDARELDSSLGELMISVEDYPDLKSDQTMIVAQQTYNEVEEQISAARRFYNSAVTALNNSIEIFPGNLIAPLAKAKTLPFYKADEASKAPVDANDFLN